MKGNADIDVVATASDVYTPTATSVMFSNSVKSDDTLLVDIRISNSEGMTRATITVDDFLQISSMFSEISYSLRTVLDNSE